MGRRGKAPLRTLTSMRTNEFLPLNDEELLFLWKGLVDEGRLSASKLQAFMQQVAGVKLTGVQVEDLLGYMDANSDGRVGMEDFKNFLSIGRLADTDPKSFMWEPKAKFQRENPHFHGHISEIGGEPPTDRRQTNPDIAEARPVVAPESKAPAKRRPQPQRQPSVPDDISGEATAPAFKPKKPPQMSVDAETKIKNALLKYEAHSWDRFITEEKMFRRRLFEQFAGSGEEEMDATEYHKMLMKWFPLASWSAPRPLRAADSLSALEYVRRRDMEERGAAYEPAQQTAQQEVPTTPQNAEGGADNAVMLSKIEAKMSYGLWLDVMNGKHRPEEHLTNIREFQAQVT